MRDWTGDDFRALALVLVRERFWAIDSWIVGPEHDGSGAIAGDALTIAHRTFARELRVLEQQEGHG